LIAHHDLPLGVIHHCQVCGGDNLHNVINLGHQAPCDSVLWPNQLDEVERVYPLRFQVCCDCSLAQIDYVVAPEELFFPDYPYRSGITQTLVDKLSSTAKATLDRYPFSNGGLVIDIGSNDGTVLAAFQKRGMRVLGVEATNIAKFANESGIETLQAFFNEELASQIITSHGRASVIAATNVFAHISGLGSIMRGVSNLLVDGGVFVTESHYLLDLIEKVQYDSIYHEHLRYYSVKSLVRLFDQYDFTLADVERIDNYGGSIRVFAVKGRNLPVSPIVQEMLDAEERAGLYGTDIFDRFADRTRKARRDLLALVLDINKRGEHVVGVGCPGRASTLLNYTGLDSSLMPYIAEQSTSLKLDLFLPGKHIPIIDEKRMLEEQPEYVVMLSWHYAKPILRNLREKGLKSKVIVPLPEVYVVED